MFSGKAKVLGISMAMILLLYLAVKAKWVILGLTWVIIIFCLFIIWVKAYGKNPRLNAWVEALGEHLRKLKNEAGDVR